MRVYDTTLLRLKSAFEHYPSPAGDMPVAVKVRQLNPERVHIELHYPDRTEELVLS